LEAHQTYFMKHYWPTRITISGPGGCINREYYVILKALRDAGFEVEEENGCPKDHPGSPPIIDGLKYDGLVRLKADHLPWGG
jgi:hypothetical protein